MNLTIIFASLAFLFSVVAYVPYARSVIVSDTKPTISAWASWWLMDAAILGGMIAANEIAWQMVAYIVGIAFVIGACVYKIFVIGGAEQKEEGTGWTRLDSFCLAIVVIAIGLWVISGNPNIAIVLSLVAITIGTVPMLANIWHHPEREPLLPWVLWLVGGTFGVLAIPVWNIAGALTPIWFLVLQALVVLLVSRKLRPSSALA